jgi:hypothetical protein
MAYGLEFAPTHFSKSVGTPPIGTRWATGLMIVT